jgi:hypothetical protein
VRAINVIYVIVKTPVKATYDCKDQSILVLPDVGGQDHFLWIYLLIDGISPKG